MVTLPPHIVVAISSNKLRADQDGGGRCEQTKMGAGAETAGSGSTGPHDAGEGGAECVAWCHCVK
jgi:hypothetical protein